MSTPEKRLTLLKQNERLLVHNLLRKQKELMGDSLLQLDRLLYLHKCITLLDLDEIQSAIQDKLSHILSIKYFSLFLYQEPKRKLKLFAHNHPTLPDDLVMHKSESGIMSDALDKGGYVLVQNFQDSRYFTGKKNPLFQDNFFVSVPLMIQNRVIGVLNLNDNDSGEFSVGNLDFVLNVTDFLALSISNALNFSRMEALSVTDGLTGLANHQQMQNVLKSEFQRSRRYNSVLSIVILDVDYFKKVNDTYGHPAGDMILSEVASTIKKFCRSNDLAARYGGEEFVVILPETRGEGAFQIAERIRKEIENSEWVYDSNTIRVTISCGVSELDREAMDNPAALLGEADQALYEAKGSGRNRTFWQKP